MYLASRPFPLGRIKNVNFKMKLMVISFLGWIRTNLWTHPTLICELTCLLYSQQTLLKVAKSFIPSGISGQSAQFGRARTCRTPVINVDFQKWPAEGFSVLARNDLLMGNAWHKWKRADLIKYKLRLRETQFSAHKALLDKIKVERLVTRTKFMWLLALILGLLMFSSKSMRQMS